MRVFLVALTVAALVGSAALPRARAAGQVGPAERLRALGEAINRGDVDAAVATFAQDGSVLAVTQGGEEFHGQERVRVWAQRLVNGHFYVVFGPDPAVSGNRVTWPTLVWLDQWRDLGVAPAALVVQVTVQDDGLIQTFGSTASSDTAARIAAGSAQVALVDRFFAALNVGDLTGAVALLDNGVEIEGALGDRVHGIDEARAYYTRLIAGHLQLSPAMNWIVSGDRVTGVYGLAVDSLRDMGIVSAETIGDIYVRDGTIVRIVARFTPNSLAAVRGQR